MVVASDELVNVLLFGATAIRVVPRACFVHPSLLWGWVFCFGHDTGKEAVTMARIAIYDTTLRDGTQGEGISLSVADKMAIAEKLDALGVDFIEGGWPGSNPKDAEFFALAARHHWQTATICAFGSTRRAGITPAEDTNLRALVESQAPCLTVVGKTWVLHVTDVLETTLEENLAMIQDSIAYLRGHGRRVIYDAEHFFDGYKANAEYALHTLRAAVAGGAECVTLCDTNGGTMTADVEHIVRQVSLALADQSVEVGIHTHNDCELAVANTLAGVQAGATQVQGTINGFGERCGNANLCSIVPNLALKLGYDCLLPDSLTRLTETAHFVAEVANVVLDNQKAFVGVSAFAHKGGIHVSAMRKNARTYQHIEPQVVGNQQRTLVSELSGRGNVLSLVDSQIHAIGYRPTAQQITSIVNDIKDLESKGFQFEGAEASVELMVRRSDPTYSAPFHLVDFLVMIERRDGREVIAEATVKVRVGDVVIHTAADGDGPVNALDSALRKALLGFYPQLGVARLHDFKVRVVDGAQGTSAVVRVLIQSGDGRATWTTVGSSPNIIEACYIALADSLEYAITCTDRRAVIDSGVALASV